MGAARGIRGTTGWTKMYAKRLRGRESQPPLVTGRASAGPAETAAARGVLEQGLYILSSLVDRQHAVCPLGGVEDPASGPPEQPA